jgi:hypothetical protein
MVLSYFKNFLNPTARSSVDFSEHDQRFDFRDRLHADSRQAVADLLRDPDPRKRSLVSDIAAAVVAQLRDHDQQYLTEKLGRDALEYCHSVILDMGYQCQLLKKLAEDAPSDKCYSMLLFGCQNRDILYARVAAAYETAKEFRRPFRIVFSGLNPSSDATGARTGKVRTICEADEMQEIFFALKDSDPQGDVHRTRFRHWM